MKERIRDFKLISNENTISPHFLVSSEFQRKKLEETFSSRRKKTWKKSCFFRFGRNWRTLISGVDVPSYSIHCMLTFWLYRFYWCAFFLTLPECRPVQKGSKKFCTTPCTSKISDVSHGTYTWRYKGSCCQCSYASKIQPCLRKSFCDFLRPLQYSKHVKLYFTIRWQTDSTCRMQLACVQRQSQVEFVLEAGIFSSFVRGCEGQQKFSCDPAWIGTNLMWAGQVPCNPVQSRSF